VEPEWQAVKIKKLTDRNWTFLNWEQYACNELVKVLRSQWSFNRMRLAGTDKLLSFARKHANAKNALLAWMSEAGDASWESPQDIKDRYRSADFLSNNRVIFNIKGNHYRLVVKVRFRNGVVFIEWIGTHAEYSKKRF
jgi:mRNA interferase HigB